jgi:DNA-binding response OmpR family regulator
LTPLERENAALRREQARLCRQVEELIARVEDMRRELRIAPQARTIDRLRTAFPVLQPGDAWILATLYAARGEIVSTETLLSHLPTKDQQEERQPKIIGVRIAQVRRALGREAIKNSFSVGYALTPAGIQLCRAALRRKASR